MRKIIIDGASLTIEEVRAVATEDVFVELADKVIPQIIKAEVMVADYLKQGKVAYGINTGFGRLSETIIATEDSAQLQENLIMSHACGVGEALDEEVVRAMMLLRINSLVKGHSGIRLSTLASLLAMLNKRVYPLVFEKGSLGASGDLCPLAHLALVLIGKGEAWYQGERIAGAKALQLAGITPVQLSAKEGLALINGTQLMSAIACLLVSASRKLADYCDLSLSLTMEALGGIIEAYNLEVHKLRPHRGQLISANNVRTNLSGSEYLSHQGQLRLQDAYSLRCGAQVHGSCRDAIEHLADKLNIEINAVSDNPLLFPDSDQIISGGNFHGESLALALDYLGLALAELANISERRIERLVNPQLNNSLPPFLAPDSGLNSGFMIAQYSAAALVSENKVLAHPASVDSIPSSGNQEDHVSMGTIAANKARTILKNSQTVIAIELLSACQALDFLPKRKMGKATQKVYENIRALSEFVSSDRELYLDIEKVRELIERGKLCD